MSLEAFANYSTTPIINFWKEIGYNEDEQKNEQEKLNCLIIQTLNQYTNSLEMTCNSMKTKIVDTNNAYSKMMKAFGQTQEQIQAALSSTCDGTLIEQLNFAESRFNKYKEEHQTTFDRFQNAYDRITHMFNRLDIHERGEFEAIGDNDFSDSRLSRFEEKLKELSTEISAREEKLRKLYDESCQFAQKLEVEIPVNIQAINTGCLITFDSIQALEQFHQNIQKRKETRDAEILARQNILNKLWNIFHTPQSERHSFINSFKTISDSVLTKYDEEISRLKEQREEKLPEIVKKQKADIKQLEKDLNMTEEQINHIENGQLADSQNELRDLNEVYDSLDQIYETLMKEYNDVKSIIESIKQREELRKEKEELDEEQKKMEIAIKKKHPIDQKKAAKDEQSRRRIKSLLPRIEKKLLVNLIEYQTKKGRNFTWGGIEYINELSDIKLSDVELQKAKGKGRKPAMRNAGNAPCKSNAAPKKRVSRKSLENHPNLMTNEI